MKKTRVAIIGLGLMGASLAAALRRYAPSYEVVGLSRSRAKIREARKRKWIHKGFTNLRAGLKRAHLVVVCTPVGLIPKIVRQIDPWVPCGCIVTDVGSTKAEIVSRLERTKLKNIFFVGSHPMAGSHRTGLEFADPTLFRRSHVFVTPTARTDPWARFCVERMWRRVGATVVRLSVREHDKLTASISHFPHVLAFVLAHVTPKTFMKYGASGFRDMTRLAQSDPVLWRDIFLSNCENIDQSIRAFQKELAAFRILLKSRRKAALFRFLQRTSLKRKQL